MGILTTPKKVKQAEARVVERILKRRKSAFERFPLLFTLLTTFGLVATLYGFQRLIDKVDFLSDNSFIMLGVGLLTLIITGTLYKKL